MAARSTKKQERAAIAAKRKRMGLGAADADDADDGVAYDPQLSVRFACTSPKSGAFTFPHCFSFRLTIARSRKFLQVFESVAGSLHGTLDGIDEFCKCLDHKTLGIKQYDRERAEAAFKAMDLDDEDALEFEPFIHAVHGAVPRYDLLWKELMAKKKYLHWRTIETGGYSEDTLKGILKNKKADFKDHITAIRVCNDVCYPNDSLLSLSPFHSNLIMYGLAHCIYSVQCLHPFAHLVWDNMT